MVVENENGSSETRVEMPHDVAKILMEPVNHGFAAAQREALKRGVPAHTMIEMLLNHLCSVTAMVEPAGARDALVKQVIGSIAPMTQKHVDARLTTPGGVILPRAQS